ncbi:InlB B-repeat-containing protein [Alicyclobacillus curvatus]|nr:InlB B-repeat-containing protein [Alicyclobacillus curvatus]
MRVLLGVLVMTSGFSVFTPRVFASTSVPPVRTVNGQQWVEVSTAAQLEYIDENQSSYLNANIMLMNSIDLTGYAWIPLGQLKAPFSGTFNGHGFEVTNVSVSGQFQGAGLFGYSTGTLENTGVAGDITINAVGFSVGVLVGYDTGSITNCYTTGSISATSAGTAGGLVGLQDGGSITNSYSTVRVSGQNVTVGGLVGEAGSTTVLNSYALGQVSDSGNNVFYGGLIGRVTPGLVTDSYYDESTSGLSGAGVGAQSDTAMKQQSTYTNWNFTTTWGWAGNYPYPKLMGQSYPTNLLVTYNSNGGSALPDEVVTYGSAANQPQPPTMTGATFDGWYSDSGLKTPFDFSTPITSVTTLYAKWTCMVSFDSNGGSSVSSETVGTHTDAAQPANPTKAGYLFGGWYSDKGLTTPFNFSTAVTSDTTLYAKWVLPTSDAPPVVNGWVQVSTPIQLVYIDQNQNADIGTAWTTTYLGANIELMNNIDLTGSSRWIPIGGNSVNPFSGTFNGHGFEVQGLTINDTVDSDVGLFGTSSGTVENLGVAASLNGSVGSNGGLMGEQLGGSITDSYVTGSVYGGAGGNGVNGGLTGGLVGTQSGGAITGSYFTGSVSGGAGGNGSAGTSDDYGTQGQSGQAGGNGGWAGGLVGTGSSGSISDSYATGRVTGGPGGVGGDGGVGTTYVLYVLGAPTTLPGVGGNGGNGGSGGFAGGLVGNQSGDSITDSYSTASATGGAAAAGGLAGAGVGSGAMPGFSDGNGGSVGPAGGLVGAQNGGSLSGSFFDLSTAGQSYGVGTNSSAAGATGESDSSMKTAAPFMNAGWDFNNIWDISANSNNGYPNLIPPAVLLTSGSMGTAIGKEITGLTPGDEYVILVSTGGNAISEYVKADGTLSMSPSDAAPLIGTTIAGWANGITCDVQLMLSAPTGLAISGTSSTQATLSWDTVTGATSYDVYEDGSLVATGVTGTSYKANNLTAGLLYKFTIRAVNAIGESVQSSAVSVNTLNNGSIRLTLAGSDVVSGVTDSVTGVVYDVKGTPVPDAIVNLSGTMGTWGKTPVTANSSGAFAAAWTAPMVTVDEAVTVTATVYDTVNGAVYGVTPTTATIHVAPPPSVSTMTLSNATTGSAYGQYLSATGGFSPYIWSVTSGSLPAGLSLDKNTGIISGTPSIAGTSAFAVQVKDSAGYTATKSLSITVNEARPSGNGSSGSGSNGSGSNGPTPPSLPSVMGWQFFGNAGGTMLQNVGNTTINISVPQGAFTTPEKLTLTTGTPVNVTGLIDGLPTRNVAIVFGVNFSGATPSKPVTVTITGLNIPSDGVVYKLTQGGGLIPLKATVSAGKATVSFTSDPDFVVLKVKPNQRVITLTGHANIVPAVVKRDAGTPTTYMPIWYVMQMLHSTGIQSQWNGNTWELWTGANTDLSNVQVGRGNASIYLNGTLVQKVNTTTAVDPSTMKPTTYMPIWYLEQILDRVGLTSTWNGTTWTVAQTNHHSV